MAHSTLTLTGKHTTPSGRARVGNVTVTPNATLRDAADKVVLSGPDRLMLAADGSWSVVLPCDSPGLNPPTGIGYTVKFELRGEKLQDVSFLATANLAGATLDLSEVVTVAAPTPLSVTKGDKGDAGPANTLTVGSVTTGAPGTPATAAITGEAPNQVLSLTIPQGPQGKQGDPGVAPPSPIAYDTDGTPYLTI